MNARSVQRRRWLRFAVVGASLVLLCLAALALSQERYRDLLRGLRQADAQITSARIDAADCDLAITASYGGGCGSHDFRLRVADDCAAGAICPADVVHYSDDSCEAMAIDMPARLPIRAPAGAILRIPIEVCDPRCRPQTIDLTVPKACGVR